jgi:phosphoribosylformimino-5-aminoimidazole carboxamide ribotide isomerase
VFEVIPAIDVRAGRCVRLVQGDFERATVYGDDPVEVARRWAAEGARRIHVVDLDGAREGRPAQLHVARDIARAVPAPVQLGGGLRTFGEVEAAFETGVDRVILGTAALDDPSLLEAALERFGRRVVVGVDARDGQVAVRGWVDVSGTDALGFARDLARRGVRTIVCTDIARDGMLAGPNLPAVERMVKAVPDVEVIASGGVSRLDDLLALSRTGARGAIVGKALYTGAVDLRAAIALVTQSSVRAADGRQADVGNPTSSTSLGDPTSFSPQSSPC